ncbi:SHOCT domain-containing protein [Spirillospora sp. NPDC047279]|uniref:SHOCT domain-containing protein n=1 Tax=Spirillospora sp. NPDC047279 TaxID=3155478 RepID=UPI0033E63A70
MNSTCHAIALMGPGDRWGHMGDGGWSGGMWLGGALMALLWVAAITVLVLLALRVSADLRTAAHPKDRAGTENAQRILAERYAHGEIDTQEYEERLAKLR